MTSRRLLPLMATALLLPATASLLGGCRRGGGKPNITRKNKEVEPPPVEVKVTKGSFEVLDVNGKPMLRAAAAQVLGKFTEAGDLQGPATLQNVKARLYKNGKDEWVVTAPQMVWEKDTLVATGKVHAERVDGTLKVDSTRSEWNSTKHVLTMKDGHATVIKKGKPEWIVSGPQAVWVDDVLTADQTAHGQRPDGSVKVDAAKAVYHSKTEQLDMQQAKYQDIKAGRPTLLGEGPMVRVRGQMVYLPSGGRAWRADGSGSVRAAHVEWNRVTGKLTARGNVEMEDQRARATGQLLQANTEMKRGTLSGSPRVLLRKKPAAVRQALSVKR